MFTHFFALDNFPLTRIELMVREQASYLKILTTLIIYEIEAAHNFTRLQGILSVLFPPFQECSPSHSISFLTINRPIRSRDYDFLTTYGCSLEFIPVSLLSYPVRYILDGLKSDLSVSQEVSWIRRNYSSQVILDKVPFLEKTR